MPIEIIGKYKDSLKYVYVIGSENGSYAQIGKFKDLVESLFGNSIDIIPHKDPVDFEDLEENLEAIEKAYERLKNEKNINEHDIILIPQEDRKFKAQQFHFHH